MREVRRIACFFFNDTATTEIYTLSLHDALPICPGPLRSRTDFASEISGAREISERSEEHTSELQSRRDLVCRLLLEKKMRTAALVEGLAAGPAVGRVWTQPPCV